MAHVLFARKFAKDSQKLHTSILINVCEDMNFGLTEINMSIYVKI